MATRPYFDLLFAAMSNSVNLFTLKELEDFFDKVVLIASAKIPEREGSISLSRFYG